MWSSSHFFDLKKEKQIAFAAGLLVGAGYTVRKVEKMEPKHCRNRQNRRNSRHPQNPFAMETIDVTQKVACKVWNAMTDQDEIVYTDTPEQCKDLQNNQYGSFCLANGPQPFLCQINLPQLGRKGFVCTASKEECDQLYGNNFL